VRAVESFDPSLGYRWVRFVHFLAGAIWLGAAVAAQLRLGQVLGARDPAARLAAWKASRRLTTLVEMPIAGAVLAAGVVLAAMHPEVFTEQWFLVKLAAVVVILFLFSWSTTRQRRVGELLGAEQGAASLGGAPDRAGAQGAPRGVAAQRHLFRTLRLVAALVAVVLIFAITVRIGSGSVALRISP
jgi:uncharacterized membrane protein